MRGTPFGPCLSQTVGLVRAANRTEERVLEMIA